jgi:hypothetical protein
MGKSEAGSARNRIESEARNLVHELRQTLKESVLAAFIFGFIVGMSPTAREAFASAMVALLKRSRL